MTIALCYSSAYIMGSFPQLRRLCLHYMTIVVILRFVTVRFILGEVFIAFFSLPIEVYEIMR